MTEHFSLLKGSGLSWKATNSGIDLENPFHERALPGLRFHLHCVFGQADTVC